MITLHESNITSFPLDNGIGVLSDAIIAHTEEELNGMFEFYMEYDSEGHLVEELKEERIIKAKAQDKLGYQLFRIYSITKNHENDNLIVKAQHITYDLANNFVEKMEANRLTKKQVMEKIGASTVIPHPFNVTSSNTTTVSSTNLYRTNPLQMIAGMEGSVLQIWGGQIERDNFNLILHDRRGHNDGVTVTYEKNITGLTAEFDIGSLVTRIFPFVFIEATENEPERLITVNGKYIDSPHINNYEKVYIEPIDYSHDERIDTQDKTDAQIRQQLESVASTYFEETGNDKVKASMDVAFMHLWETEEYKNVKVLELVGMGDTVTINHSRLKVDTTAIVNYIRYDCIAHVNEEVRLGNVKAGLTDSLNKIDAIERKAEQAESNANQAIVSANGKNTTFYGPDEPSSAQKGDLWFKLVDGQYNRTYRYDGIEWQLIIDMDSAEAKQLANEAKQDAEQSLTTANHAINTAQASFDKAQENASTIDDLALVIGDIEEDYTTITATVDGLQTTVTDLDGNVSNLTQLSNVLQSTVSSLQDEFDNLEIGGRNLLPSLFSLYNLDGLYGYIKISDSQTIVKIYDKDVNADISGVYFGMTGTGIDASDGYKWIVNKGVIDNDYYLGVNNNYPYFSFYPKTKETFDKIFRRFYIKIEKGNKATDWTPAPEDMATQSQITQLSDAINLRVAKGDVINQINLDTSGVLISGKKLILDGDTTVTGDFKLDGSAHIKDASIGTAQIGTIDAAIANIINLSANSIVGGVLQSQNDNITFDLNNSEFIIRGGGQFIFQDSGNGIKYVRDNHASGIVMSTSSNATTPLVAIGVDAGTGVINANSNDFRGILIQARELDRATQYIATRHLFAGRADLSTSGIMIRNSSSDGETRAIYGWNSNTYDYDLGLDSAQFIDGFIKNIKASKVIHLRDAYSNGGWRVETRAETGATTITFRGINTSSWNYNLGASGYRINRIYLANSPDVSSDERLKTDISDNKLGLDFVNGIETKQFRLIKTDDENKLRTGIIAQQVLSVLNNHNVDVRDFSLINKGNDGYYGVQYEQFIPILIRSVQDVDIKYHDEVEYLKLKVQYLEQKIEQLEGVV